LPFGGYKGSAIALMVELLAGGLIGEAFAYEASERDNRDGGPPRGGELLIVIDPSHFGDPNGWLSHSEKFFMRLLGIEGTRLPADRRHTNRTKASHEGVHVPESVVNEIRVL